MGKHPKLIFSLVLSCLFLGLQAQKPVYATGKHIPPDEAKKKKNRYSRLYASSEEEFFVADKMKGGLVITVYNNESLKKQTIFTLEDPKVNGKDPKWFRQYFNGEEITTIYSYYDSKEDKNTIYGNITNRDNKEIVKDKVLLSFAASKKKFIGNVGIIRSKDKTKFLIYREPTSKQSPQETVELWMYDDQLEKIYKKKLSFPYKSKQFVIQDYLLTNSGKVIIIAYYQTSKQENKNGEAPSFKIFGVDENKEELEEINVSPKGKALSSAFGWILDSGKSIAFTGFYRDDMKNRGANGIFYVRINTNAWEEEVANFSKISEEQLNKIFVGAATSDRAKKRAKKAVDRGYGLNNFLLKELFFDDAGNIRVITQLEYMTMICTRSGSLGNETCTYYYYSRSIVEFDLDAMGNIVKTVVIPKEQMVTERPATLSVGFISYTFSLYTISPTNYLGHVALLGDNKVYYVYNDADQNFNPKKVAKHDGNKFFFSFNGGKKSRLVYASYSDKKDKAIKTAMTTSYKDNIMIMPDADVIRMADGSVIVWGKIAKSKELILMRFYLKDKE
jgi:hypothetical protein